MGLPYEKVGEPRRKIEIQSLKETSLGVAPKRYHVKILLRLKIVAFRPERLSESKISDLPFPLGGEKLENEQTNLESLNEPKSNHRTRTREHFLYPFNTLHLFALTYILCISPTF